MAKQNEAPAGWKPVEPADDETVSAARFTRRARFRLDEDIDPMVGELLRENGFSVQDCDLRGHDDEDQIAAAFAADEILLAHDVGYLNERRHPPHRNPGIVVIDQETGTVDLSRAVFRIANLIGPHREAWHGATIRISDGGRRVTIRRPNSKTGRRETEYYYADDRAGWFYKPQAE